MKKFFKFLGYLTVVFIGFSMLRALISDENPVTASATASEKVEAAPPVEPVGPTKAEIEKAKAELVLVKKSFKYREDEFSKAGWYTHKIWRNGLSKPGLEVHVNKDGWAYLSSYYQSDDWLFHNSITVKLGEQVLKSEVIPSYNDNNVTDHSGGTIWETVSYLRDTDNGILRLIAAHPKKTVKVRFNGRQYYHDITLTKTEKAAIAECVKLANLLELTQAKSI